MFPYNIHFYTSLSIAFSGDTFFSRRYSLDDAVARLQVTSQRLGAGGAFTNARTGAKISNSHKLSGEPLPRLRQTARYVTVIFAFFPVFQLTNCSNTTKSIDFMLIVKIAEKFIF